MNTRGCATVLVGLCLATVARGEETVTSRGVTYRIVAVNSSYHVRPVGDTTSRPSREESLARCDDLVAAILARATAGGRRVEFVRDRVLLLRRGRRWVDYSQRHQGYRVVGAGARVNLNENGRIDLLSLQYESEEFPTFVPRDTTVLREIAVRAVPDTITGPPFEAVLMIDPRGEAPSRLIYFVIFPVRAKDRDRGWQVDVDAVTGEVLHSETTTRHVIDRRDPSPR